MPEFFTSKQVAEMLLIDLNKVCDLIANGDLVGTNIATNAGGIRPRWRISREALDAFLAARQTQQPAPTPRRKRREEKTASYY